MLKATQTDNEIGRLSCLIYERELQLNLNMDPFYLATLHGFRIIDIMNNGCACCASTCDNKLLISPCKKKKNTARKNEALTFH